MIRVSLFVNILLIISLSATAQLQTTKKIFGSNPLNDSLRYSVRLYSLPGNYYVRSFGFFCKKELEIEHAIKVPMRFRLGSVGYCDMMEGKTAPFRY